MELGPYVLYADFQRLLLFSLISRNTRELAKKYEERFEVAGRTGVKWALVVLQVR